MKTLKIDLEDDFIEIIFERNGIIEKQQIWNTEFLKENIDLTFKNSVNINEEHSRDFKLKNIIDRAN